MSDLWITDIAEIATPVGSSFAAGPEQRRVERTAGRDVLCRDGRILAVAPPDDIAARAAPDVERLSAGGGTLVPGFVDAHTHLPWAGSRESEFSQRLAGKPRISRSRQPVAAFCRPSRRPAERAEEELTSRASSDRLDQHALLGHHDGGSEERLRFDPRRRAQAASGRSVRRRRSPSDRPASPTLLAAHEVPAGGARRPRRPIVEPRLRGDRPGGGGERTWRGSATSSASGGCSPSTSPGGSSRPVSEHGLAARLACRRVRRLRRRRARCGDRRRRPPTTSSPSSERRASTRWQAAGVPSPACFPGSPSSS